MVKVIGIVIGILIVWHFFGDNLLNIARQLGQAFGG